MKESVSFALGGTFLVLIGYFITWLIGDPAFPIRAVQSGSHEGIFVLLGLVIGFTLKDRSDSDSIGALVAAVFMAVSGFLTSGLEDLNDPAVQSVGNALSASFFICLYGTVSFLLRAIKNRPKT
ncbi:hypothetical protein ACQKD0_13225 [Vreelandella aquamarina]|uniref:hypothetical protein n=1 Tax=Vreelandella aquamarina TaxID=77097 RepID=UPI003D03151D